MATLSKALFRGAATTTVGTTLYTVPAATTTVVTDIVVTNTTGTEGTFTLGLAGTSLATTVAVAGNDSTVISLKQVLATTNTITGGASAVTINFHISGIELS
jgi:ABC-type xylose transport system substrate-binding protein